MLSSPFLCYLVPLGPKCLHQHPILEHPEPMFLPQCDGPIFTPTKYDRTNFSSVCLKLLKTKLRYVTNQHFSLLMCFLFRGFIEGIRILCLDEKITLTPVFTIKELGVYLRNLMLLCCYLVTRSCRTKSNNRSRPQD
jgi:hypothetical protein